MNDGAAPTAPVRAFLVGPTGVGKTEVAVIVARSLGAEIINIDSRQVYRQLEIGTAKPTHAQRRLVAHHLVDCLDPSDRCSAGLFLELVRGVLKELRARRVSGLAVGGAGLYVDACLGRLHRLPPGDPAVRLRYEEYARDRGAEALHHRLAALDPIAAKRLAPRDRQRVIRAIEVAEGTGRTLSQHYESEPEAVCPPDTPVIYVARERRDLYARIEERCRDMVAEGLAEEALGLLESGLSPSAPGLKTLGYVEWGRWAVGECSRDEAMELFMRNSRRYAKRQETWFRNRHPDRIEIKIPPDEKPPETAQRVLAALH